MGRGLAAPVAPAACAGAGVRVLLYADVDLSLPGGVETHVRELASHLTGRGHDVEIFGRPALLPPFRMVGRVDPARYDVIHQHAGVWPRELAPGRGSVRTIHFCTAEKMAVYLRRGRLRTLANPGNWRAVVEERSACHRPGAVIAVAEHVRAECERWYGLAPGRARVIPNGASFAAPREGREQVRARWGIAPDARVLLTIGRADFVKGYDLVARAWRRARLPAGSVWVIVGGAVERRAPGRVMTGPLPPGAVIDWIHAADVGALPSYYEGLSIAFLELLAAGRFTLAHDVGDAARVLATGAPGRIVPRSVDAWVTALEETLAAPPAAGPVLAESFRWSRVCEAVERVYAEAVAG